MQFKNFFRDVWRPMQLRAEATGKNMADVDFEAAMRNYVTPQSRQQVASEARKTQLGFSQRGLDLQKDRIETQKKVAPYAIGLGAANVGLSGMAGLQAKNEAERRRELLQKYINEVRATRRGLV